jgi:hypothetical protein
MFQGPQGQQGGSQGNQNAGPQGPPPAPGALSVHIAEDGATTGPFNQAALQQKVQDGSLSRDTMVWMEGMDDWQPAGAVDRLQSLFRSTPPPPPAPGDADDA